MPFLPPNQQCQSTEGNICNICQLEPGLIWFKLGLAKWAVQNQFNPGKMPTLHLIECDMPVILPFLTVKSIESTWITESGIHVILRPKISSKVPFGDGRI